MKVNLKTVLKEMRSIRKKGHSNPVFPYNLKEGDKIICKKGNGDFSIGSIHSFVRLNDAMDDDEVIVYCKDIRTGVIHGGYPWRFRKYEDNA